MIPKNILVTGPPRCGKTTLIEKVTSMIDLPLRGFFTRELKEKGRRRGFAIVTIDGIEGILAHESIKGRIRIGKYYVSLQDLETIAVPSMIPTNPEEVIIVDEIGKMECYSALFRDTLIRSLNAPNPVIGSIALKGGDFIQSIKKRSDVEIVTVSDTNRDDLVLTLASRIDALRS